MLIFQSLLQILSKIPILKQIIQAVGSQQQVYTIQHKWYVLPFLLSPRPQLLKQNKIKTSIQLEANKCDPLSIPVNLLFCPFPKQLFSMQISSHGGCSDPLSPLP